MEWNKHRHRATFWGWPHAAVPGNGLSAGAWLQNPSVASRAPAPLPDCRLGRMSSCRARGATATCAACSAAPPRLVTPAARVIPIPTTLAERGVLMALAATARHAIADGLPDLIVGHGVLDADRAHDGAGGRRAGRLESRIPATMAQRVTDTRAGRRRAERLYAHLRCLRRRRPARCADCAAGAFGEIVLAGFYSERLSFCFRRHSCGKRAYAARRRMARPTTWKRHAR